MIKRTAQPRKMSSSTCDAMFGQKCSEATACGRSQQCTVFAVKALTFQMSTLHELPKSSITKLNVVLKKTNEKEELHRCSVRDASFT